MKKILLFAAAALALLSCSKEDVAPPADLQAKDVQMPLFHATTETSPVAGTKVYADEDLKVLWNSSDSISIFQKATFYRLYRFTGNDGDTGGHVWTQVLIDGIWVVSDSINRSNSLGEVVNWNNNNYKLQGYYSSIYF